MSSIIFAFFLLFIENCKILDKKICCVIIRLSRCSAFAATTGLPPRGWKPVAQNALQSSVFVRLFCWEGYFEKDKMECDFVHFACLRSADCARANHFSWKPHRKYSSNKKDAADGGAFE